MSSRDDFGSLEPNLEDLEDLDRYEPLDDLERGTGKRRRGARILMVAAAVLITAAAAGGLWYALERFGDDEEIPLVEADRTPVKVRPDEPGGMQVPHQEIAVLNQLTTGEAEEKPQVEVLMPPPEMPLPVPPPRLEPVEAVGKPSGEMPAAEPTAELAAPPLPAPPAAPPLPEEPAPPAPPPQAEVKSPPAPSPAPAPSAAPAPSPAAAASPTPAPAATGYRAQVAAFRSEAAANRKVGQMRKRYANLFGPLPLQVRRADRGAKGIWFRVQAGAFAEKGQATALCEELKRRGEKGCFVVR
ncbi:MAG: SPOR domain-containing protein [Kiloniellales bacterium]